MPHVDSAPCAPGLLDPRVPPPLYSEGLLLLLTTGRTSPGLSPKGLNPVLLAGEKRCSVMPELPGLKFAGGDQILLAWPPRRRLDARGGSQLGNSPVRKKPARFM